MVHPVQSSPGLLEPPSPARVAPLEVLRDVVGLGQVHHAVVRVAARHHEHVVTEGGGAMVGALLSQSERRDSF